SDKWITERTGIRARHFAEPGTTTLELATRAAQSALDNAGLKASDLDMILVGTSSPDGPFPSIACRIQDELDAPGAVAWDLLAACTSFMYGLSTADSYIASERADKVLVIGAEVLSRMLDYSNRGTAVIFGDGAGAAVVTPAPEGAGFLSWCLGSDGRGYEQVTCGNVPLGAYAAGDPNPIIDMRGPDVISLKGPIALLFPGQGVQKPGMGKSLYDRYPAARRAFERAEAVLDMPVRKLCFDGPVEELNRTEVIQPCVMTVCWAAYEVWRESYGFENVQLTA